MSKRVLSSNRQKLVERCIESKSFNYIIHEMGRRSISWYKVRLSRNNPPTTTKAIIQVEEQSAAQMNRQPRHSEKNFSHAIIPPIKEIASPIAQMSAIMVSALILSPNLISALRPIPPLPLPLSLRFIRIQVGIHRTRIYILVFNFRST